jgi:hypothetical protein
VLTAGAAPASAHHLFAEEAGFERTSTVRVARTAGIDVDAVIAPWNRIAGRQLFAVVDSGAQITFQRAAVTWVQPSTSYTSRYTACTVHYAETTPYTLSHELGHCLGFADHINAAALNAHYINPAVCDALTNAFYNSYKGVMSYCSWNTGAAFGREDRAMLEKAGYVGGESEKQVVEPVRRDRTRWSWSQYKAWRLGK